MAKYQCTICGEIYDEAIEKVKFDDLPDDWVCPLCRSPKSAFVLMGGTAAPAAPAPEKKEEEAPEQPVPVTSAVESMPAPQCGGVVADIRIMADTGKSIGSAMETQMKVPGFEDILVLGAQLGRFPLDDRADVNIRTVIGKNAEKPMVLETPVFVSHMSFGALSANAKIALSKGSAMAKTAMCSGEGGALSDEMYNAYKYVYEYPPNKYSFNDETLENSAAVEIKIGQGTKPGMGGHLPGDKVTQIIAMMRDKPVGQDIISPSRFPGIDSPSDLKDTVDMLRKRSRGLPIGVKIAAGHIEEDLAFIAESGCDFITIDGRGGATGSSPKFLRDVTSVPTVYALARARKYMDGHGMKQDLVITGGFRTSGDVVKALAMGADAVALASGPLIALGCQRYRACGSGKCPMGIATQDWELEKRLDVKKGAQRVANYLNVLSDELRTFCRITGHGDVHDMSLDDLCTTDSDIASGTGIRHA